MVHLIGIKATNSPIILNSIQQMLTGNFLREEDDWKKTEIHVKDNAKGIRVFRFF